MDQVFMFFIHFVHFGLVLVGSSVEREYHYVDLKMTWTEAQHYCRARYSDLAAFDSMDDINKLNWPDFSDAFVWIGLNDDPRSWEGTMGRDVNSWRWSATGTVSTTGFHHLMVGGSFSSAKENCVVIRPDGKWADATCSHSYRSVCQTTDDLGHKMYVLIEQPMTWHDASAHCRTLYTDLAMIENEEENTQVLSVKLGHYVWIGLYREPWRWSDGSTSSFRNWVNGEPNNVGHSEHCVVEISDHRWLDAPCDQELPFLCYKAPEEKTTLKVKMEMKSSADLSDPRIRAQILQQMEDRLRKEMPSTDFQLRWTMVPTATTKKEETTEAECLEHV